MAKALSESTKISLRKRLSARAAERWEDLAGIDVRYRSNFAYVTGRFTDGTTLPLCRLRYLGSEQWFFGMYLASKDGYEDSILPNGSFTCTPEEALDCACGLYLG